LIPVLRLISSVEIGLTNAALITGHTKQQIEILQYMH